eukprot:220557-Amorphochlora_amoeboformis.AAC.1
MAFRFSGLKIEYLGKEMKLMDQKEVRKIGYYDISSIARFLCRFLLCVNCCFFLASEGSNMHSLRAGLARFEVWGRGMWRRY